jgi:hypothetical protein
MVAFPALRHGIIGHCAYNISLSNLAMWVHRTSGRTVAQCGVRHIREITAHEALTGGKMGISEILAQIDREIAQLQQARALLSGKVATKVKKVAAAPASKKSAKKRNLTPEGRKRIAEAVKRRWAEQKKAAGSK